MTDSISNVNAISSEEEQTEFRKKWNRYTRQEAFN